METFVVYNIDTELGRTKFKTEIKGVISLEEKKEIIRLATLSNPEYDPCLTYEIKRQL